MISMTVDVSTLTQLSETRGKRQLCRRAFRLYAAHALADECLGGIVVIRFASKGSTIPPVPPPCPPGNDPDPAPAYLPYDG